VAIWVWTVLTIEPGNPVSFRPPVVCFLLVATCLLAVAVGRRVVLYVAAFAVLGFAFVSGFSIGFSTSRYFARC
jgi:hypothetical protein